MSKFSEWVEEKKGKEVDEPVQVDEIMQPDALVGAAAIPELRIRATVKKRLQWLFDELRGYNLTRPQVLSLVTTILDEFEKEFNFDATQQRRAVQMARANNTN